jgi:hypothetical protein
MNDIALAKLETLNRLHELQFSSSKKLLIVAQDPTGFGAQVSRRILGLKLALYFDRTAVFLRDDDWPYVQAFERPHTAMPKEMDLTSIPIFDLNNPQRYDIARFDFWKWWAARDQYPDFFHAMPDALRKFENGATVYEGILCSFLKLTPAFLDDANRHLLRLGIGEDVIGVHIRRGDKNVETPFIPISLLANATRRLIEHTRMKKVFVATDDLTSIPEFEKAIALPVIFDPTEVRYNNANHKFLMRHPELALAETRTAVKNLVLLKSCGAIVGQTNAHFASLAAGLICARKNSDEYGILIPGNHVLESSAVKRFFFASKKTVRRCAKILFPFATLKHRTKA